MNITKNSLTCKSASTKSVNFIDIGSGNIVPHWWYQKILTTGDKADTIAITILSELWFLYRSTGQQEHQKDYSYFCNKFTLTQYQVREAFIRLEALNLMRRSIGTIEVRGRRLSNTLFVTLHVTTLLEMAPSSIESSNNNNYYDEANNKNQVYSLPEGRVGNSKDQGSKINEARISKNKIKEDRSIKSNFVNVNSNLEKPNSSSTLTSTFAANKERFSFASFYPLAKSDINTLQTLCGREFSENAINEILKNLSIKLPSHSFPNKAAFVKYMGKALTCEMRDAVKISNENFRIASNISVEESTIKTRETYLSKIENSRDPSRQMQLKRKLAGALAPSLAYSFLTSASFVDDERSESSGTGSNLSCYRIDLCKKIELSELEHQLILTQVQSVYGKDIDHLDIVVSKSTVTKESLSIQAQVLPETKNQEQTQMPSQPLEGIWGKIRQGLVEHYGSNGIAMDNAWFSKLTADIDATGKKLTLKAPTKFIKDWIQSHYLRLIDQICSNQNYNLIEISM